MKNIVAPTYDQGYAALIEDLSERGLLQDTLVVNMAEFGRTPKVNPAGGRDHWPQCFTVGFAGGGVRGGQVVERAIRSERFQRNDQPSHRRSWPPSSIAWDSTPKPLCPALPAGRSH